LTPSPLVCALLALAAFRSWRLLAQDTFPPIMKARAWAVGYRGEVFTYGESRPLVARETLAEWIQCAWCSGLWLAAGWYGAWLLWPRGSIYAAAPMALSAAAGIIASILPE
jgi:uncharacterized protein DUF1360